MWPCVVVVLTCFDSPQAACGLTIKPKNPIAEIDLGDLDNELAVVEYVEDMYKFYKQAEVRSLLCLYHSTYLSIDPSLYLSNANLCGCRMRAEFMTTLIRSLKLIQR